MKNKFSLMFTLLMAAQLGLSTGMPKATITRSCPLLEANTTGDAYDYSEEGDSDIQYPTSYDLRHVGGNLSYDDVNKKTKIDGGISYVTPVKLQNPWGTCWAFGIMAAAESSILYEAGQGTEAEGNTNLDLSERHLAWFAKNHLPAEGEEGYGLADVNNQEGEGMWYSKGTSSDVMSGGMPYLGTSVFAAGMGIVPEDYAPYYGKDKEIIVRRKSTADATTYPNRALYYDSLDAWNAETDQGLKDNYYAFCYSDQDDWSLDESLRFAQSYALEESNILPAAGGIKDQKTGEISLNKDGIAAVKEQLSSGKGVEVAYYADNFDPNIEVTLNTSRYINQNFAHYTWDQSGPNHSVCIVGWDDDYDASHFGQDHPVKYTSKNQVVYKLKNSDQELTYSKDGKTLSYTDGDGLVHTYELNSAEIEPARETDGSMTRPAGNGAWIVKNSWGGKNSSFPNYNAWGAEDSGFFYLSYYDTSICFLETYDFIVTDEEKENQGYTLVDEYDFMPAMTTNQLEYLTPMFMCNVFTADEDMELDAVSCQTTTPNTKVNYYICLLDDDESHPEDDDDLYQVNESEITYQYGGYHRQALKDPIQIAKGQKYAVLVSEHATKLDSNKQLAEYYFACSNKANYQEGDDEDEEGSLTTVGIVNPGESYLIWLDDSEKLQAYDYSTEVTMMRRQNPNYSYDNFSIKAYGKPAEINQNNNSSSSSMNVSVTGVVLLCVAGVLLLAGAGLFAFASYTTKEKQK